MKSPLLLIIIVLLSFCAQGQGTFVFDQQSSTDETPWPNGSGTTIQQITPPYGQSFTPSLSAVDFIRLNLNDPFPANSTGATLFINLKTSINGSNTASTAAVTLPDSFAGIVDFFFSSSVTLTPGQVYYFQPVVQSGDSWGVSVSEYGYPGGSAFAGGIAFPMSDFWFREGILVPEPASAWLLLLGGGVLLLRRRKRPV